MPLTKVRLEVPFTKKKKIGGRTFTVGAKPSRRLKVLVNPHGGVVSHLLPSAISVVKIWHP